MSELIITPISKLSDLEKSIRFRIDLYKDNPYAVPPLIADDLSTLNPRKNAAFEFCESQSFLAYRDGQIVGRVTGIIHHRANETWNKKAVRFTYLDFIDDPEVSAALIQAVEKWGKNRGMTEIEGPMGFTDLDQEGMLIEGFEELGTMVTFYNYPYYVKHIESLGFEKSADWIEFLIEIAPQVPERYVRIADVVRKKFKLRNLKFDSVGEIVKAGYATKLFELVNRSYTQLHGFTQMTQQQIDSYVKTYIPMLDARLISLIVNEEDRLVGMGVAMPSLSKALQKSQGSLFPFGWFHLLKTLKWKHDGIVDLMIVAVDPDYQGKGVNSLLFTDLQNQFIKMGFKYAESNPELEVNEKVQAQWDYFNTRQHKKRRAYRKSI